MYLIYNKFMFRFPEDHDLVHKILKVTEQCFTLGCKNIFNDVFANSIQIIYLVSFISYSLTRKNNI